MARLKSDKLGNVSPVEFIPLAEETMLIVPIGKKILHMSCDFLKKLESLGFGEIKVSVNISAIQLLRDEFIDDLLGILAEHEVRPSGMGLEITESVFAGNFASLNEKLLKLKETGFSVSLDDFGTGYSSLARGRELHVDCLKIDRIFIEKLAYLAPEEAITGDIISMAHKLGQCVVAEGVDHEKQKQYLVESNCDYMQGYLFSRPIDAEDAIVLLAKQERMADLP